jgi:HNH endonuclease
MKRSTAAGIAGLLRAFGRRGAGYHVTRVGGGRPLRSFHEWADGKALVSADRITRGDGTRLILLLIDWADTGEFYYVIFPADRSGPLAEVWRVRPGAGTDNLLWTYAPKKRDGKNDRRVDYFRRHVGDVKLSLAIPTSVEDVPRFLDDTFALVDNRMKADALDPDEPAVRDEFPEGAGYERLHTTRERNAALVQLVKKRALAKFGKLACEICAFDFARKYGPLGHGFIEAHHTRPLSELTKTTLMRPKDMALVCSNCHRMVHRRRPWLRMGQLRRLLQLDGHQRAC